MPELPEVETVRRGLIKIAKGRKIIGWDEILDGGASSTAAVMSWRGDVGGIKAANSSHHVIMTPGQYCYSPDLPSPATNQIPDRRDNAITRSPYLLRCDSRTA